MREHAKPRGKVRDREDAIANTPETFATQLRAAAGTREFFASSLHKESEPKALDADAVSAAVAVSD